MYFHEIGFYISYMKRIKLAPPDHGCNFVVKCGGTACGDIRGMQMSSDAQGKCLIVFSLTKFLY